MVGEAEPQVFARAGDQVVRARLLKAGLRAFWLQLRLAPRAAGLYDLSRCILPLRAASGEAAGVFFLTERMRLFFASFIPQFAFAGPGSTRPRRPSRRPRAVGCYKLRSCWGPFGRLANVQTPGPSLMMAEARRTASSRAACELYFFRSPSSPQPMTETPRLNAKSSCSPVLPARTSQTAIRVQSDARRVS